MPCPGCSVTAVGSASSSPRAAAPSDEALGEDVGGHLVDRGREAERLFRSQAAERHDPFELRLAEGERARLVEQHGSGSAEPLQSARPP